jgi:hypothetical protein
MAGYQGDDEFGGRRGGRSEDGLANLPANATPEQIQKQIQEMTRKNEAEFRDSFRGKETKDGKVSFFGYKIPKYLAPIVNIGYDSLIVPISDVGSNFLYNRGAKLAEHLNAPRDKAHQIGLAAELVTRWGIVFSKPIISFATTNKQLVADRRALYKEFQPIVEGNKIDYKNNEVVKAAFNHLHAEYVYELKRIIPSLITLSLQVPYALQRQKETIEKRKTQFDATGFSKGTQEDYYAALTKKLDEKNKNIGKGEEFIAAKKKEWLRNRKNRVDAHGKEKSDWQLDQEFEKLIAAPLREVFAPQNKSTTAETPAKAGNKYLDNQLLYMIPVVSAASEGVSTAIRESRGEISSVNSWEMIKHLSKEMESRYGAESKKSRRDDYESDPRRHKADSIRISTIDNQDEREGKQGRRPEELSLKEYIIETFQQLERDMGRPMLGPALLEQLTPAVDIIAEYIAEGRLDPYALVSLVGNNKIITHSPSGSRVFANEDQVKKEIDDLLAVLGTKEKINSKEFLENFVNPAQILGIIKKNLETMQGQEKAFFVMLFSDEILMKAGMKQSDAVELRKQGHAKLYDEVAAAVISLAKHDPETAKTLLGLSEEDQKHINELAERIESGDWKALETAVDGRDKSILAAVRTGGLNQQSKGNAPWAQWLKESMDIRKTAVTAQANSASNEQASLDTENGEVRQHQAHDRDASDASDHHRKSHSNHHKKSEKFTDAFASDETGARDKSMAARIKKKTDKPHGGISPL